MVVAAIISQAQSDDGGNGLVAGLASLSRGGGPTSLSRVGTQATTIEWQQERQ